MTLTFEERITRLADTDINNERIKAIEKSFDSKITLVTPGRALVGEGILTKECRKKPKPRYFFLFNDILVYGTSVMSKKKYVNPHVINLNNVQIKSIPDSSNPKLKNGWLIMSPKKSFCVYATTSKEKIEWMTHISNCIEKLSDNRRKAYDSMTNIEVAPQWIPDKEADTCMRCRIAKFSLMYRRHHCRNCGYVVCSDCSKNKYLLPSQSDEALRVCNTCYTSLSNNASTSAANPKETTTNTDSSDESENDEPSSPGDIKENDTQFYNIEMGRNRE